MNNDFRGANPYAVSDDAQSSAISRNRVLRNTYWLLSLSMIPTIFGALLGIQMNFAEVMGMHRGMTLIIFFFAFFTFSFAIERFKNSLIGVALLLSFTFFMGIWLSAILAVTLQYSNGLALIAYAFGSTAIIFGGMATIATVSKRDFSGMGSWLTAGALIIVVAAIGNMFLQIPALYLTVCIFAIIIFSGYMLFDVNRVVNGGETNYISATLRIYLDIYIVFQNLLALFGIFGGNRD